MKRRNVTIVPMPHPGEWMPMANTFTHECCNCGAKHKWRFSNKVIITRNGKPRVYFKPPFYSLFVKIAMLRKGRKP